jgi:hypothetical protein
MEVKYATDCYGMEENDDYVARGKRALHKREIAWQIPGNLPNRRKCR